ncbi:MAG: 3-hydroxyacyl-ACP dehydratase FabZ [Proteobacteria bacterium]|nr:3-hydroxyacyl-ACP dehydratase FabZ [Pseudomonadota bacterium]MBU4037244.1 3-hydroxyacyl-ACP dehydratase FabZ [Pseudomonadota bacterium]
MEKILDVTEIMKILPHRYPFILIDRILELVEGEKIVALKNVTINEQFFQGHFPGMPIMPGVLIIEAMAQAGGVLFVASKQEKKYGDPIYFMGMDKVRFRKPVVPGDQIIFDIKILNMRTKVAKIAGVAKVDGKCVAEAELMAAFGEKI